MDDAKTNPAQAGQTPPEKSAPEEESMTFFNVMPKIKKGTIVMPEVKTTTTPAAQNQATGASASPTDQTAGENKVTSELPARGFFSRFKVYIILAIFVGILGPLGYFFIPKFFTSNYQVENFVVDQANRKPTPSNDPKSAWLIKYFEKVNCEPSLCGDQADPDRDGLTNLQEYQLKTDPNNADSDKDGLADGDEVNVFGTDPLKDHSGINKDYSDSDYAKNGYNPKTDKKFTDAEIKDINAKIKDHGLNQPSIKTLETVLNKIYKFDLPQTATSSTDSLKTASSTDATASSTEATDMSPEAKLDRDTQRSLTITNIGIALLKYYDANKAFPSGDFSDMFADVKIYLKVATEANDPVNSGQMVYTYTPNDAKTDFVLTYFNETLNQVIKKTAKNARDDKAKLEASALNDQRRNDLEQLRSTLLVYSDDNIAGNQTYVFPTKEKYKTTLVPKYITSIPKDPKTGQDYEYSVSDTFDTFTLKAIYDSPQTGKTGYMCNQEECRDY